jgi:LysM repeat protein
MKKQDWDTWNIQAIVILLIGILLGGFGYHNYSEMWQERQERIVRQERQKTVKQPEASPRLIVKSIGSDPAVSETRYVIRKGDTLTKIAARFCDDVSAIAKRSGIKNIHRIKAAAVISVMKKNGCSSPERAIQKHVSPVKFAVSGRASQEKRLTHPESSSWKPSSANIAVSCHTAAFGKKTWREQTLAIHNCVQSRYGESIRGASEETRLPEQLILAVLIAESSGNPLASLNGCRGLMQLLTSTAAQYGVPENRILDPDANIRGGARVLADYTRRYAHGDLGRALASYNLGPTAVARKIRDENFDPSSYFYVVKVKKILRLLEAERKR